MNMIKVKLKSGINVIGNARFELVSGQIYDISEQLFDANTMDKVDSKNTIDPVLNVKSFRQELIDLPIIGPMLADKILKHASSKIELIKVSREILAKELSKESMIVLDKYLNR